MNNRVKYLRRSEKFNLTQQELANHIGVSRHTVIAIENGKNTSADVMLKLSVFFDKDARDIFFTDSVVSIQRKSKQEVI